MSREFLPTSGQFWNLKLCMDILLSEINQFRCQKLGFRQLYKGVVSSFKRVLWQFWTRIILLRRPSTSLLLRYRSISLSLSKVYCPGVLHFLLTALAPVLFEIELRNNAYEISRTILIENNFVSNIFNPDGLITAFSLTPPKRRLWRIWRNCQFRDLFYK